MLHDCMSVAVNLDCDDDQPTWFSTPSTRVPAFSHFFLFNPSHKKNPQVRPCRCVVASRTSLFGVITQTWYTALVQTWYTDVQAYNTGS